MSWLCKWWMWLVAAVGGLFAFFLIWKKKDEHTPYFDEAEGKRRVIEEELEREKKQIEEEYEKDKAAIEKDRAKKRAILLANIDYETDVVKDDPQKINEYLEDTDEEMRK